MGFLATKSGDYGGQQEMLTPNNGKRHNVMKVFCQALTFLLATINQKKSPAREKAIYTILGKKHPQK